VAYGSTQCYLPPGRGDIPAFTPAEPKLVLDLATPEGCKAELAWLAGYIPWRYTRPKTITHPSTNRARRMVTSFVRRMTLATTWHRRHNTFNVRKAVYHMPIWHRMGSAGGCMEQWHGKRCKKALYGADRPTRAGTRVQVSAWTRSM